MNAEHASEEEEGIASLPLEKHSAAGKKGSGPKRPHLLPGVLLWRRGEPASEEVVVVKRLPVQVSSLCLCCCRGGTLSALLLRRWGSKVLRGGSVRGGSVETRGVAAAKQFRLKHGNVRSCKKKVRAADGDVLLQAISCCHST